MALFKPMLADNKVPTMDQIKFPIMVSPKLDGIRCTVQEGKLYSRSLKEIPNRNVQALLSGLPEGLDGELIYGDPWDDPYRRTTSIVMSDDKPADGIRLFLFDWVLPETKYHKRFEKLTHWYEDTYSILRTVLKTFPVRIVPHFHIEDAAKLDRMEETFLEQGYEGLMINSIDGEYKHGRSTIKEGTLLKLKRFLDGEAKIIGFTEEMENTNEAKINELGKTERSSCKAGMVPKGSLGNFLVVGVGGTYEGIEFAIGGGFTAAQKAEYWKDRNNLLGKLVVYKFFPTGSKDKPRIPIFKGFRDERDI